MVKREKGYIKAQKKKYRKYTIIWSAIVIILIVLGVLITHTRQNYFTLVAALLVICVSLNLARWMSYIKFKDGDETYADYLEQLKGDYVIFHSAVIPDTRVTILFEHIIVTGKSIYLLSYDEEILKKNRLWLENRLMNKGLKLTQIHFECIKSLANVKNVSVRIQKDAFKPSSELEEYTQIIEELLM